jgi:hypothetical protein
VDILLVLVDWYTGSSTTKRLMDAKHSADVVHVNCKVETPHFRTAAKFPPLDHLFNAVLVATLRIYTLSTPALSLWDVVTEEYVCRSPNPFSRDAKLLSRVAAVVVEAEARIVLDLTTVRTRPRSVARMRSLSSTTISLELYQRPTGRPFGR